MLKNNLIFSEGKNILVISFAIMLISYFINFWLFSTALLFILFSFYFFRNPDRFYDSEDNNILISPADGKIISIESIDDANFDKKISIFLSPVDVHVNWIPVDGIIKEINYKNGEFLPAYTPKSSERNERNDIVIESNCGKILVRQIAGTVARRIVCWSKINDSVKAGDKFGMIKFSSRIDLFLPRTVVIDLKIGQRVYGGQSIIGRWSC